MGAGKKHRVVRSSVWLCGALLLVPALAVPATAFDLTTNRPGQDAASLSAIRSAYNVVYGGNMTPAGAKTAADDMARGPGGFRRVADGISFSEAVVLFRARLAAPDTGATRRTVIARAYQTALKRLPGPEDYDRWNALMIANRAWYAKVVIDLGGKLPKPATPID